MEKELSYDELSRLEYYFDQHRHRFLPNFFIVLGFILIAPILPSRRGREMPESFKEYLSHIAFLVLLTIPALFYSYYQKSKNLKRDLERKKKIGTLEKVIKKERLFADNRFFIINEEQERIEVSSSFYHKASKGDQIVIWKSEHAEMIFEREVLSPALA